ncbi:hypothetical protein [Marinobacter sp.]|uniref:hypothetical protein n=1 Tax=Marinobacter sp. TaxID=50741 RepID=UPI00384F6973
MSATQKIVFERGLLRVVARTVLETLGEFRSGDTVYDVEIHEQEVLHTFPSLGEATQFVHLLAPLEEGK